MHQLTYLNEPPVHQEISLKVADLYFVFNLNLCISVPILPIFLFQNELKMKDVQKPSETTMGPKIEGDL